MKGKIMKRRKFVQVALAGGGVAALGGQAMAGGKPGEGRGSGGAVGMVPRVALGRTGVEVSRLGIGCGPFRREGHTPETVLAILEAGLALGVNYVDVAPNYGEAESKLALAMGKHREKLFLVTKTEDPTYEGTWRLLRASLQRMGTDRVDLVHLHNLGDEDRWPDLKEAFSPKGAMGALREAKEQGLVRFVGASGHVYPSRFLEVLDGGEIDVLMNATNYVARQTYDFEGKLWAPAREKGIGLVAMKVLGGQGRQGRGASRTTGGFRLPAEDYENALRYALALPGMAVAVIGIDSVAELQQAAAAIGGLSPLTAAELEALAEKGRMLAAKSDWQAAYGQPLT